MKKHTITIFLTIILTIILSGCNHTGEPLYIHQKFTQLNTVITPWEKDNDLLPWKGQGHMEIINSIDDIYATQTERFIEENQNWLNVDFSTKSILAIRSVLFNYDYWQFTKVISFAIYNRDDSNVIKKGEYSLFAVNYYAHFNSDEEEEDHSNWRIFQIAIVTDKIPSNAEITANWSLSVSPE